MKQTANLRTRGILAPTRPTTTDYFVPPLSRPILTQLNSQRGWIRHGTLARTMLRAKAIDVAAKMTESTLPVEEGDLRPNAEACPAIQWIFPVDQVFRSWLRRSPLSLGREGDCDITLEGRQVSRRHARVLVESERITIVDLSSRNGTFVNGRAISTERLRSGDLLRVGEWIGIIISGSDDIGAEEIQLPTGYAGPVLQRALRSVARAATTDLPIILQGATGTGKECAARAIHAWSGRPGAFVGVNCSAIPEQLAEAELFGYRRGAFTGAEAPSTGYLRASHRGTLLLDEIGDLPLSVQAKLLRAIEQREVQGLGESRPTPLDLRVIAAGQKPLDDLVASGSFRADLFQRLNGITATLPTLAERRQEIPAIFDQLLRKRAGGMPPAVDAQLIERLCLYGWPGNVRELDLQVRRLLGLHGQQPKLLASHLSLDGHSKEPPSPSDDPRDTKERDARDLELLLAGLAAHDGNVARAAGLARISRQRAYRLLESNPKLDLATFRKRADE